MKAGHRCGWNVAHLHLCISDVKILLWAEHMFGNKSKLQHVAQDSDEVGWIFAY